LGVGRVFDKVAPGLGSYWRLKTFAPWGGRGAFDNVALGGVGFKQSLTES
jgi:hypothetical protein